jgi:hypothetical protein
MSFAIAVSLLFLPGFLIGAGLFSLGKRPVVASAVGGLACGLFGVFVQFAIGMAPLFDHR